MAIKSFTTKSVIMAMLLSAQHVMVHAFLPMINKNKIVTMHSLGHIPAFVSQYHHKYHQPRFLFGFGNTNDNTDDDVLTKQVFCQDKLSSNLALQDSLKEYIKEWTMLLSKEKLTTPIQVSIGSEQQHHENNDDNENDGHDVEQNHDDENKYSTTVVSRIKFVPRPGTGKYYKSAEEEHDDEEENSKSTKQNGTKKNKTQGDEEGGLEIIVSVENPKGNTEESFLSVKARRYNYGDEDVTIKEMSEETILSKLKDALMVWKREH